MFADVSGSSEHAERMDPEEYAEVLAQFRALARQAVESHGGIIARLQGDGLLALFGHIETGENDARHAVEAALDLHAAVARLSVGLGAGARPMRLHSGIHAGLVLLLEGGIELGRYDVVGEVPNTAARLSAMAGAGEIFVSAESLGPMAPFFQTRSLGEIAIRGRSEMLKILHVSARSESGRRIDAAARRGTVGFIGRQSALSQLHALALRCRAGDPAVVVVRGEAGIGKTRLVDEFLRRLPDERFAILRGYSESGLGAQPLQPFMQMLRAAGAWRPGASAVDAVRELVTLSARKRTVVVVLDDWQWADDLSRQTLLALRENADAALFLVATRPMLEFDPDLAAAEVIDLPALSAEEAAGAVAAWLPDANEVVVQEICGQSGGSPLFIEELCHAAAAGRGLRSLPQGRAVAWLDALVASRLDRLPADLAEALRVASVLGGSFETSLLAAALDTHQVGDVVAALQEQDFLLPHEVMGLVRFKHVLTRNAVYATVPLERRRALHAQVAQLLLSKESGGDGADQLEALSYHFHAAGRWREAARFAQAAGDKAFSAMSLDHARAQYMTALQALDSLPALSAEETLNWCAIAQRLGQTCVFDALDVDRCIPMFERAALLAARIGDAQSLARAHYWLGYVHYGKGQPRLAVAHCRAASTHAQACDDSRLQAQVAATLGQSLASAGHYDEALPLLRHAYEAKRRNGRPGSGTAIGSAYTLARTGFTLGDIGRFDEAHACFDDAFHLLGDAIHAVRASVLELQCAVHLWQGRWAEAEAAGLHGAEVALRCRSRFNTEMGRALAACAAWAATRDASALQVLRGATLWIESHGGAVSTSLNYGWLVEATLALDLQDEARRHAAALLMRARALDQQGLAQGLRALALEAVRRGDERQAARWMRHAERAAERRGSRREQAINLLTRAQLAVARGHIAEAVDQAGSACQAFEAMRMAHHAAQARALATDTAR